MVRVYRDSISCGRGRSRGSWPGCSATRTGGSTSRVCRWPASTARCGDATRRGSPARGRVRAKTGYISRVVGLSGYVPRDGEEPWIFSILVNDFVAPTREVQRAVDRFIERLCAQAGPWAAEAQAPLADQSLLAAATGPKTVGQNPPGAARQRLCRPSQASMDSMKNYAAAALLVTVGALPGAFGAYGRADLGPAPAQQAGARVAVFDMRSLLAQSTVYKAMLDSVKKQEAQWGKEMQALQARIGSMRADLELMDQTSMEAERQRIKIDQLNLEGQRLLKHYDKMSKARRDEARLNIYLQIERAVAKHAAGRFDIVLRRFSEDTTKPATPQMRLAIRQQENVIYADKRVDITKEILQLVDGK